MTSMLHETSRNVRHAVRQLIVAPTFSIVAIVTLALGIGANTAIFSVVNALLLRPLPYAEPDRLLFVDGTQYRPEGEVRFQLSYTDIETIREHAKTLVRIAAWNNGWGLTLEGTDGGRRLNANFVGNRYFDILAAAPMMGRVFTAADHDFGANPPVVILSEATWRQEFGSDPAIIGREVRLQNRVFAVVGVMPAAFTDVASSQGTRVDVWSPVERAPELFGIANFRERGTRNFWAVARLAPGASPDASRAELDTIGTQIAAAFPATNANFTYRSRQLATEYFADARQPLLLLMAGSLFVLLIACANVANLLLVRSTDRSREFAVRQAVGASPARIVRQLLAESAVLAIAGAIAGLAMAAWLTPALLRLSNIDVPDYASVSIDTSVLAMTVVTALLCGLLFGPAPIWRARKISVRDAIGSARIARASRGARVLAGVEITAAFVLAAAALLMLQSFAALTETDLLFRTDRLLTVRMELPADRYVTPAQRAAAGEQLLERLRTLPGVEHATIWGPSMFARSTWIAFLAPTDRVVADTERLMVWRHSTNPGALSDLGIRVISGRDFSATDTLNGPPVAIISETTARRLWPDGGALGRQLRTSPTTPAITVVGVAADARHRGRFRFSTGASAFEPQLDIYLPYAQRPNAMITLGVRTSGAAEAHTNAVRASIAGFDRTAPVFDIATLESRLKAEAAPLGFAAVLLNVYGALAIALAAVGVYGVLAAAVATRTREIGIRSALGANPRQLLRSVIVEGLMVATVAVAVGSLGAWALSRSFGGLLFGVAGNTSITLVAAAAILIVMAIIASVLPARRAASVDPLMALRAE
jgi:predicted permease